jgi:hypothetical protein
MDDIVPPTEPNGALTPPPTVPAVASETSFPLTPEPSGRSEGVLEEAAALLGTVARRTLDFLDELGDTIAETVGLRGLP